MELFPISPKGRTAAVVRVTEEQLSLLKQNAKAARVGRDGATAATIEKPKRIQRRIENLPENILEGQITGFLRARGWVCTKQHCGVFTRGFGAHRTAFTIGETGQADWRAERPIIPLGHKLGQGTCFLAELFYFEVKRPGIKPKPHQLAWIYTRQMTGITADWFNDFRLFLSWYGRRYGTRAGDPPANVPNPKEW